MLLFVPYTMYAHLQVPSISKKWRWSHFLDARARADLALSSPSLHHAQRGHLTHLAYCTRGAAQ